MDSGQVCNRSAQDRASSLGLIVARRVPALKHSGALAHLKVCMLMFLSLCLCSSLNYTSEGDYILFGSGQIASAQSRRKGLSDPLAKKIMEKPLTLNLELGHRTKEGVY